MGMQKVPRGAGASRGYWVYVPDRLPGSAPLLMMLHGGRQSARQFADATRMNQVADEHGFAVVYPQQARWANPGRFWRWYLPAQATRGRGEARTLTRIAKQVLDDHGLDPARVAVAGLSAGGAMAAALAVSHPEVFRCAAVHSGVPYGVAKGSRRAVRAMREAPVPRTVPGQHQVLVIHGEEDTVVNPTNASRFHHQFTPGEVPEVEEVASPHPERPAVRSVTTRDGSRVEVWRVRGLGHSWSGGLAGGSYSDPDGPDASRLIADFLSRTWA